MNVWTLHGIPMKKQKQLRKDPKRVIKKRYYRSPENFLGVVRLTSLFHQYETQDLRSLKDLIFISAQSLIIDFIFSNCSGRSVIEASSVFDPFKNFDPHQLQMHFYYHAQP